MASGAVVSNITADDHFSMDEDRPIRINVTENGTATGTRVDLTGFALEYKVFREVDGDVLFVKTSGAGIELASTLADATMDQAVVTTTDADKAEGVPGATYQHYLKRTDDDNEEFYVEGTVVLTDIGRTAS